jgi:uncharacterized RDD family membrane protein YckC
VQEPELDLGLPESRHDHDRLDVATPMRVDRASDMGLEHLTAGVGPRILAWIVDVAILGGIDAAVVYFTLKICGFTTREILLLPVVPLAAFLLVLGGGYFVAFVAAGGQTIGKMAAGIKVVPMSDDARAWNDRVRLGTAFVRAATALISIAPAGIGLIPAVLSADHRALHDRLAHTRVVKA